MGIIFKKTDAFASPLAACFRRSAAGGEPDLASPKAVLSHHSARGITSFYRHFRKC